MAFEWSANVTDDSRMLRDPVTVATVCAAPKPGADAEIPAMPGASPRTVALADVAPLGTTTCDVSMCAIASASVASETVRPPAGAVAGAIETAKVWDCPRTTAIDGGRVIVFDVTLT